MAYASISAVEINSSHQPIHSCDQHVCCNAVDRVMYLFIGIVLYTLSVGPAWWLHCRTGATRWMSVAIDWGYCPIWFAYGFGPCWVAETIARYMRLWGPWNSAGF